MFHDIFSKFHTTRIIYASKRLRIPFRKIVFNLVSYLRVLNDSRGHDICDM